MFHALELRVERLGTRSFVRLCGEFDLGSRETFKEVVAIERRYLSERHFSSLVIDLRDLRFIDSTGLGCLLTLWKDSQGGAFNVHFVRGSGVVERLFSITRVDQLLPLVDSEEWVADSEV